MCEIKRERESATSNDFGHVKRKQDRWRHV